MEPNFPPTARGAGIVLLLVLLLATSAVAQDQARFAKGDFVVLAVPIVLKTANRTGLGKKNLKWDVEGRAGEDGLLRVLDGRSGEWIPDWRLAGFPLVRSLRVTNVKTVNRPPGRAFEVTLRVAANFDIRVFAPADQRDVLNTLLARAEAADSVYALAYDSLGSKFFVGPLEGFSPDERRLLLRFAHLTANGTTIGHEEFKGVHYMEIGLAEDENTWNDLVVTRTERIGKIISEQLSLLKGFAKVAVSHSLFGGIKLSQKSRHGTAPDYLDVASDEVQAYFPLEELLRFAEADITSQQLVDASIVLVGGDRVQIDLGKQ